MATWEAILWSEFREAVLCGRVRLIECSTLYNKLSKGKYPIQRARAYQQVQNSFSSIWEESGLPVIVVTLVI